MSHYLGSHCSAVKELDDDHRGKRREDVWKNREQSTLFLSIAIFGSQGSGKSSLLKTFVDQIRRKDGKFLERVRDRVSTLRVIEPNLVAEDEHFLYTFLAHVWTEIEKLRDVDQSPEALSPVERTFQEVGEYLHVVDPRSTFEKDPLGISLQRLDRHRSGPLLEEKIWELITRLARRLGGSNEKTLLILPVDDADISYHRLLTILDTYRRYLRHPQLVPVFTFTSVMAEELLRVHYAQELHVREVQRIEDTSEEPEGLTETYTPARMTRQLASQFLARLFPNRHRIRLRLGAARLRRARYSTGPRKEESVEKLLERASLLLFGEPEQPNGDKIRRVLKPATLRRQLQIVDVLAHIRIEKEEKEIIAKKEKTGQISDKDEESEEKPIKFWADAFDDATWAVMNIHRDVLSQLNLHVEELYGWTRRGLRPLVLEAILSLPLQTRRKLIQHWILGSRDRRCQVLSLLGAQVARPPVEGSEDFEESGFEYTGENKSDDRERDLRAIPAQDLRANLAVDTAFIWFLDVWFGFYMPQVLIARRETSLIEKNGDESKTSDPTVEKRSESQTKLARLHSAGWGLRGAATNALQESLGVRSNWTAGILNLSLKKDGDDTSFSIADLIDGKSKNRIAQLLVAIWCNWGVRKGQPWSAVSLWRGLSLVGRILFSVRRIPDDTSTEKVLAHEKSRVEALLKEHCRMAPLPSLDGARYPGSMADLERPGDFPPWPPEWIEGQPSGENPIGRLAKSLVAWRLLHCASRIKVTRDETASADRSDWERCFVRRLHGEYLLGHFWQHLNRHHFERPAAEWNAEFALKLWFDSLLQYWREPSELATLIRTCPLLTPFCDNAIPESGHDPGPKHDLPSGWQVDFKWQRGLRSFRRLGIKPQPPGDDDSSQETTENGEEEE